MFEKKGYIVVPKSAKSEEELFEIVTDAGAEDLRTDEDNFEIITAPGDFDTVLEAVKKPVLNLKLLKLKWSPRNTKSSRAVKPSRC